MPRHLFAILAATTLAALPLDAGAQGRAGVDAYFALLSTPAGTLPPSALGPDVAVAPGAVDVFYSRHHPEGSPYYAGGPTHYVGVGAGFSRYGVRWGALAGTSICSGCNSTGMLRVDAELPLVKGTTGPVIVALGLQPALGYGRVLGVDDFDSQSLTATLGMPASVTLGTRWRGTMYLTPTYARGAVWRTGDTASGHRAVLGAGARVRSPAGVAVLLGGQRVFIEGGETIFGLGMSLPVGAWLR